LEAILGWHTSTYLSILLGRFKDVFHNKMGNENSHDLEIEHEGDGVLDIYENALVIAYLQASEIFIELIPKEHDQVMHWATWCKWEKQFSLMNVVKWMSVGCASLQIV